MNGTPEVVETIHSPEKFNRVLGIPASSPSVLTRGDEAASESCGATGISTSISTPSSEYSHAHALPRTPEQQIQQQMPTHAIDMGSLERVSAYQLPPMYNPQWQAGHTRSSSSSSSVLELEVKAAVVGGAYGQTVQGSSR